MRRVFITGDIHGDLTSLFERVKNLNLKKEDVLILLGDNGLEYYSYYTKPNLSAWDERVQKRLKEEIPSTVICVQGNHEVPFKEMHGNDSRIFSASAKESNGIYFVHSGQVLNIDGKSFLVLGGAYSVDKVDRLNNDYPYWEREELSNDEMKDIFSKIRGKKFNYVLSHTSPRSEMPKEALFDLDEEPEARTENFLEIVKNNIEFDRWFCGHFHINKTQGKFNFLLDGVETLEFSKDQDFAV